MKKSIVIALFFLLSYSCFAQGSDGTLVKTGDKAPAFTVEMLDGTKVNLTDLKGKVVVINFWATWCPPCRQELKRVDKEIVERFAGEDFIFIAVSRGETKATVRKFIDDNGYKFRVGLDPDKKIFSMFAKESIPRNFLIDKEGVIRATEIGYSDQLFDELISKIEETLK